MTPLTDADFNRAQGRKIKKLIAERMREMPTRTTSPRCCARR